MGMLNIEPRRNDNARTAELDDLSSSHELFPADSDLKIAKKVVQVHHDVDQRVENDHPWKGEHLSVEESPGDHKHHSVMVCVEPGKTLTPDGKEECVSHFDVLGDVVHVARQAKNALDVGGRFLAEHEVGVLMTAEVETVDAEDGGDQGVEHHERVVRDAHDLGEGGNLLDEGVLVLERADEEAEAVENDKVDDNADEGRVLPGEGEVAGETEVLHLLDVTVDVILGVLLR